jgi:HAD superfamily hydrolase (TIGR01509 family)
MASAGPGFLPCYSRRVSATNPNGIAMIFDLDGVLVHSMPLHTLAWERYLEGLGITVHDLEARMHGKRNPELVREFLDPNATDEIAIEHGAAKERLFRKLMREAGFAQFQIPGLIEFLERYRDVPKAIGSNAEPANIDFTLDHFGLRRFFKVTVNGMEVERPKPFPDIYLKAAERLGKKPEQCIVFEDSPPGAQAGISAGMRVVGVETTPTQFEGVALRIRDFTDPALEPWLQAQFAK